MTKICDIWWVLGLVLSCLQCGFTSCNQFHKRSPPSLMFIDIKELILSRTTKQRRAWCLTCTVCFSLPTSDPSCDTTSSQTLENSGVRSMPLIGLKIASQAEYVFSNYILCGDEVSGICCLRSDLHGGFGKTAQLVSACLTESKDLRMMNSYQNETKRK